MQTKPTYLAWLILAGLALTWGSSFILIKHGLAGFSGDNTVVGALRIVISFIVLLPLALTRLRRISRRQWGLLAVVGVVSNAAPSFLFAYAQTGIDSNMAGILNSLTPLFTLLIGLGFFRISARWYNVAGVFAGLLGAIGLIYFSGDGGFIFSFRYAVFVLLATICYATSVNIIKSLLPELDALSITSVSFLVIGIPLLIYLLAFTGFIGYLQNGNGAWAGLGYITILGVMGTALALIFFNQLIKMTSALFAASVTYLIPLVAIAWGWIDGEQLEWNYLMWIVLILAGVYMVNIKPRKIKKNS